MACSKLPLFCWWKNPNRKSVSNEMPKYKIITMLVKKSIELVFLERPAHRKLWTRWVCFVRSCVSRLFRKASFQFFNNSCGSNRIQTWFFPSWLRIVNTIEPTFMHSNWRYPGVFSIRFVFKNPQKGPIVRMHHYYLWEMVVEWAKRTWPRHFFMKSKPEAKKKCHHISIDYAAQ